MTRLRHVLLASAVVGAGPAAAQIAGDATAPAAQRGSRYVQPYIEVGQVLTADLTNDDTLTYTQVAAGIDAGVSSARAQAQVSYRYEHRFGWGDDVGDGSIHTGLARGDLRLTPALTLGAGALATRARSDIRGDAPGNLVGNVDNVAQVYSVYAGPTLATTEGPFDIGASYLFGYTKAEAPGATGVSPLLPALDVFDDSTSHLATASVGIPARRLGPFGVTLSGAYERSDAGQLDQRYEGWFGRGDVVVPVSRTLAVRGGVGYEKIEVGQRDPLTTPGGGIVRDGDGRFVTDPNSPVRIAYDTDGLIYDAGVIWRPSARLELQANAGYRYGGETYFGSLNWAMANDAAVQVVVYDGVETFGRQLRDGLSNLPTSFQSQTDPFDQQFAGCIFGARPGAGAGSGGGAGGCLNQVFQSIATASYRARGVDAVYSVTRGRTAYGVGGGYAHRKLYAPRSQPGIVFTGLEDESAYAQAYWSRQLTRVSTLDGTIFGNWYGSGLPGAADVYGIGANATYTHQFGRLGTLASLGVYGFDSELTPAQWSAQALVGARYTF